MFLVTSARWLQLFFQKVASRMLRLLADAGEDEINFSRVNAFLLEFKNLYRPKLIQLLFKFNWNILWESLYSKSKDGQG